MVARTRDDLHRLIDELPESEILAAVRFLKYLRDTTVDPVLLAFLDAPEDDESWTDEDEAAVTEARADIKAGRVVTHDKMTQ